MTKPSANIDFAFQPGPAGQLTSKRIEARQHGKHRLTYDCMSAIVAGSSVVKCKKRHKFRQREDGGMALLSVLKGRSSSVCRKCLDYDGEIAE